jgi:hypothetical protein
MTKIVALLLKSFLKSRIPQITVVRLLVLPKSLQ